MAATLINMDAVRDLVAAGLTDKQAEAVALHIAQGADERLATKTDIAELRADIAEFKTDIKDDFAALRFHVSDDMSAMRNGINVLRSAMDSDMATVRTEMSAVKLDAANNRSALIKWMFTLFVAGQLTPIVLKLFWS